ncbi:MAG: hypothetical protein BBJ57_05215 [Desulfobacterales bacterium PC51MH44]|nr:MAG: hypothetical protein BBJ57_05215 [Desulfobacterales bacterium PC51MH44]
MILVGQGDVGKTCLAKRLIYDTFQKEDSTEGIDILPWNINAPTKEQENIKLNVWDFGGQEIYHSTHQFFLTKRSLYLLVWNARKSKDYEHIDYWLHTIEAFGGDSPVILVLSKCNEREDDLNMKDLRDKFPNIADLYKVDSEDGTGIDHLKQIIRDKSWALPHMQTAWVSSWLKVRERLEEEIDKRKWIGYKEFKGICNSEELDKKQTDIVDDYLHDLGVIIHFRDHVVLKNMVILKPEWATDAVYKILDTDNIREREGMLLHSDLDEIWDTEIYPADTHSMLLKLMERFGLSYELPDKASHLVAELLPSTPPEFEWDDNDNLHFFYRYSFLPPGILPRFIVGANQDLEPIENGKRLQWREGAVLKIGDTRALVKLKRLEKLIEISIHGSQKREVMAVVRNHFDHINSSIKKVQISQRIPCNCSQGCPERYDYQQLLAAERADRETVDCRISWKKIPLSKLLDGYERKKDRMKEKDEKGVYIDNRPIFNVEGGKATAISRSESTSIADVDIKIDVKVELPAMQDDFSELKEALVAANPQYAGELEKIEDSLDEIDVHDDKSKFNKPMSKMRRLLNKIADENSDIHKAVKGVKKGVEIAQKVGKTYNKFAQWLALPQVPDLFLG